jgi:hypothetical protein
MPSILSIDFVYYLVQLLAGTVTWACLVALAAAGAELLVSRERGTRNASRYDYSPLRLGLTGTGLLGIVGSGLYWLSAANPSTRGLAGSVAIAFWLSAAMFDIGTISLLTSEGRADS